MKERTTHTSSRLLRETLDGSFVRWSSLINKPGFVGIEAGRQTIELNELTQVANLGYSLRKDCEPCQGQAR